MNYLVLTSARCWIRHLRRHLHRWSPTVLPSVPLLSNGSVLCLWNYFDVASLIPLQPDCRWRYLPHGDHTALFMLLAPSTEDPRARLLPWLHAPLCSSCGRPLPLNSHILYLPESPYATEPGFGCWTTPPGTPLTSASASRSTVCAGPISLAGVLPTSTLLRATCDAPPIPAPTPLSDLLLRHQPPARPLPTSSSHIPEPLRLLSINCGGVAAKIPQLIALILAADPDIICLQEAAANTSQTLLGLPFRSWHGPPIRGGGLVTLIHPRRLHPLPIPAPLVDDHAIVITVPISPSSHLSVANLHLPPTLPSTLRRSVCSGVAAALTAAPRGAKLIAGDLNVTLHAAGSWLRQALGKDGVWNNWHSASRLIATGPDGPLHPLPFVPLHGYR